ncbi:MAG TPA: 3,4-dihydroxy-2-butanone-4-phosphate synthase [Pseudonocardia sp.]|nr:3,4-dihydroxy-2-butanone-4-phosphate synthase [Pseudonocardia sp.]
MTGPAEADARVRRAVAAIGRGRPVLVVDDPDREDEGDLVLAADAATPDAVAFVLRHTSGVLCVALPAERCDALDLPLMVPPRPGAPGDAMGTAFTVSVDARAGTTTGISATERATTIRLLADPAARRGDFTRPGHVFPLRARDGGVLARRGHTEAAVDLARLAGRAPAGLICEVVSPDHRRMAGAAELRALARAHDLPIVTIAELVAYRRRHDAPPVRRGPSTRLPTPHGTFTATGYLGPDGLEHLVLTAGPLDAPAPDDPAPDDPAPLVRLHRECLAGDPFGGLGCDCHRLLGEALAAVAAEGRGAVVYLRAGRRGALRHLPAAPDPATLTTGVAVLRDLGVRAVRLLPGDATDPADLAELGLPAARAAFREHPATRVS